MAKVMFEKEEAKKIMEILESGQALAKGTIRSEPVATKWLRDGKASANMAVQVTLEGMRSFRIPYNTEIEKKLASMLVPGRQILFTYGNVEKADAKQTISTFSGSTAKAPAKFTNYFDVDIVYVGKGEPMAAMFDDDLGDATVEVRIEERESGVKGGGDIPEVGGEKDESGKEKPAADTDEY